jgi:hypothetical protein
MTKLKAEVCERFFTQLCQITEQKNFESPCDGRIDDVLIRFVIKSVLVKHFTMLNNEQRQPRHCDPHVYNHK